MPITQERLYDLLLAAEFFQQQLEYNQVGIQNVCTRVASGSLTPQAALDVLFALSGHADSRKHERIMIAERMHYKATVRRNAASRKYMRKRNGTQEDNYLTGPEVRTFGNEDPNRTERSLNTHTNPGAATFDRQPLAGIATPRMPFSFEREAKATGLFDAQGNLKEDDPRQVEALQQYEALRTQSGAEQLTPELLQKTKEIEEEGGDWDERDGEGII